MDSRRVLDIFKEITTIPRESGHEQPMTEWLQKWAASRNLFCKTDETGNVLITREAAPGKENVPTLVLQSHQDMVCEKNAGVEHDFSKDPIKYEIKDGWMVAEGTTLGADDGIGIAATLAMLEDSAPTGKLEGLFTISEETGMDGAMSLKKGFFTGKTLINLDSEDEGQLFVGCAGGVTTTATFNYTPEPVKEGWDTVKVTIDGGRGGHSGDDINKDRANTVQLMALFLLSEISSGLQVVEINGGGKHNAIARYCTATVAVKEGAAAIMDKASRFEADIRDQFHKTDPSLKVTCEPVKVSGTAVSEAVSIALVRALAACPHGMAAMSQDIDNLVQTSTNLASVSMKGDGKIFIVTSQRSSSVPECRAIAGRVRACFELAGAEVRHENGYPGWNPDLNSHLLKVSVEAYRKLFDQDPLVLAIHAGLECGLFLNMFPGLDMISFGPTLRGVHAPGEKLEIASMDKFVKLLEYIVVNYK